MDRLGYSILELMFGVTLSATLAGIAVPNVLASVDDTRAAGAVRYLSTKLHQARMEAVLRSRYVAFQFVADGTGYSYAAYVDGNGDGVRTRDIQNGVDPQMTRAERLADRFSGVDFGVLPGLPAVDSGSAPPGADPIKLGTSNILSFTPQGTASAGSLYVLSRGHSQFVIRIAGETGKIRILRYDARLRQWRP